jgi:hypothetical protein
MLNAQERDELRENLRAMKFGKATGRLRTMDKKGRLAYYRNVQMSGQVLTRYILPTYGVQVTLIETSDPKMPLVKGAVDFRKQDYEIVDVLVEPTAGNDR